MVMLTALILGFLLCIQICHPFTIATTRCLSSCNGKISTKATYSFPITSTVPITSTSGACTVVVRRIKSSVSLYRRDSERFASCLNSSSDASATIRLSTALEKQIQQIKNINEDKSNDGDVDLKAAIEGTITKLESDFKKQMKDEEEGTSSGVKNEKNNNHHDEFVPPYLDVEQRFQPTIGLYNVSYVLSKRKGENPVGGKWTRKNRLAQRLLSTRRTMQHIIPANSTSIGQLELNVTKYEMSNKKKNKSKEEGLNTQKKTADVRPVVAEAVNVITLDALWNLIRVSIILRGDAVPLTKEERTSPMMNNPLTSLAIKAFFDPPRIVVGKTGRFLNLCLGPKSSVVLDTTYVDDKIRIGMGGTSGTRFIFTKCARDDKEAEEFKKLLVMKPTGKSKILTALLSFAGAGGLLGKYHLIPKILSQLLSFTSLLIFVRTLLSTGGIEQDELRRGRKAMTN